MSKFLQRIFVCVAIMVMPFAVIADDFQVSNSDFEDWSGAAFDGNVQPKGWNASNVTQFGFKFNFAHQESGHTGNYSMMVQDQDVGAAGITETSPGYFSLGQPWVYIASLTAVSQASAGTYGGINWTHRPDTMSVWIKRTGSNTDKEDFYLLFYSWAGNAQSNKYKGKNGSCTTTNTYTNEESDIRQEMDGNECGTVTPANPGQIAEGMWRERKTYGNWTNIRVPIYYFNNNAPQKMNIIFSASNYPNFRANSGLYSGNSLYVDDVEFIYSAKIQKLYVNDKEWLGFDPNTESVQTFALGESATEVPDVVAYRGVGSLTNARGKTVQFPGRKLEGSEIQVTKGNLTNTPTVIKVTSEDGKSVMTYKIQFQKAASSNAKLASISVNGLPIAGFSPTKYSYNVVLPFGTTAAPVVTAVGQEEAPTNGQKIEITQATSTTGSATIKVTAPNGTSTQNYVLNFSVGLLADNELQDILVNGKSIPGFTPSQTIYKVSLPDTTTVMPVVTPVSKPEYGTGQSVAHTRPSIIDGGTYTLSVTTPGNDIPKVYKLTFKLEKSSYTYLKTLEVLGEQIEKCNPAKADDSTAIDFTVDNLTYYVNLKMGTKYLPQIVYTPGDPAQTIVKDTTAGIDGTTRITVTAGNGDQSVYKLVFSTAKSEISTLAGIKIGGVAIPNFRPDLTSYADTLPEGTEVLPEIEPIPHDEFQAITVTTTGVNGKARITVTAGNGSTTNYYITFSVRKFTDNTLADLHVGDAENMIQFHPDTTEYWVNLEQGTAKLPKVTYTLKDENFQTATPRPISGVTGDYKITVRPQSGASNTYIIHFSVATSNNADLTMLYIMRDGVKTPVEGFHKDTLHYYDSLPIGSNKIPAVSFDKAESSQRVLSVLEGKTQKITVTAQDGKTKKDYYIHFIPRISTTDYLKMIYVDDKPLKGFESKTLTGYTYELIGETCPAITVDKEDGQQVTITAPYATGVAQIKVMSGTEGGNTYEINFVKNAKSVLLKWIAVNNIPLNDFDSTTFNYTATYEKVRPTITYYEKPAQSVQVLWKNDVVYLNVQDTLGNHATYSIAFTRNYSGEKGLKTIKANGVELSDFSDTKLEYSANLAPGSNYPEITYELKDETTQRAFFGQVEAGKWEIKVVAEDGSSQTYKVTYIIDKYSDINLAGLAVEGYTIDFVETQTTYGDPIPFPIAEGDQLPKITATPKAGQSVIMYNENDTTQKVLVMAENGNTNTYLIKYTRVKNADVTLKNIFVNGAKLPGFDPEVTEYTYDLERDAKVVPNVSPIANVNNQTVTTYFSRPNGTTKIVVKAQSGATGTYLIHFPVKKSDNTFLKQLLINEQLKDSSVTEYRFPMSFNQVEPYSVKYTAEEGQLVRCIEAPITGTTKIIVTNEKGDNSRTYTIDYDIYVPEGANAVKNVKYSYTKADNTVVTVESFVPVAGDNVIDLPSGTKDFTILQVDTNYKEQTIMQYDGGIRRGAKIIAVANRAGEEDVVYNLIPRILPDTVGKLKDLQFRGVTVPNFSPDVYNYMVNLTDETPVAKSDFTYTKYVATENVEKSDLNLKNKQITISVENGETYNVCWFYAQDKDPFDFTETWVTAGTTGYKPSNDWHVIADYSDGKNYELVNYNIPYVTGKEVSRNGVNGVMLSTMRQGALCSSIPGMMSLSAWDDVYLEKGEYKVWEVTVKGVSRTSISQTASDGVQFRNTPEWLIFDYNALKSNTETSNPINAWSIKVYMSDGSTQELATFPGNYNNKNTLVENQRLTLNYPTGGIVTNKINAILNSCGTEQAKDMNGMHEVQTADLVLENMHLTYNSALTAATVNGNNAPLQSDGRTFLYNVPANTAIIGKPALKFTGAVHDQMQTIEWLNDGEWINGELTARVINYGENSLDSTHYYVVLHRNPVTSKAFTATFGSYPTTQSNDTLFVNLPYGTRKMPNLTIEPTSTHQLFTMTKHGNAVTVNVKAEDGSDSTVVYVFREVKANDVEFAQALEATDRNNNTVDIETVDLSNFIYKVVAEQMPIITYYKKTGQTVDLTYSLNGATIVVTAQDGKTQRTYTINRENPDVKSNGQLDEIGENNSEWSDLGDEKYRVSKDKPNMEKIYFKRLHDKDSVVYIQTPDSLEWKVFGDTANHSYVLAYPVEKSSNAQLSDLLIGGVHYSEFNPSDTIYPIQLDTMAILEAVESELEQRVVTQQISSTDSVVIYKTVVTAADGVSKKTYRMAIYRSRSKVASLAGIYVDGALIDGFDPKTIDYTITLPLPASGIKQAQPLMPTITYAVGQAGQQVTLKKVGTVNGDETELFVQSEDGQNDTTYTVTVVAEKSRCVDLTGISVNSEPMDQFEAGRHFYSRSLKTSEISVSYTSDDYFQTVTHKMDTIVKNKDNQPEQVRYTLHVVAESGLDSADYEVMLYIENQSSDAQLANILLDNRSMDKFEPALNPDIVFDGGNNNYIINLPYDRDILPEVSAQLKMEGQKVEISRIHDDVLNIDSVKLVVTAVDNKTSNTYSLRFQRPLSSNAELSMIYLNGDSIDAFDPGTYFYHVDLPVGTHTLPEVVGQKGEVGQTILPVAIDEAKLQATIKVQAQDASYSATYVIAFQFTQSDVDTLAMIYQDGDSLVNFRGDSLYYANILPVGTTVFPDLSWEVGDEWQSVSMNQLDSTANSLIRQIIVTSESRRTRTYTISYTIEKSRVDTLQMLFVDQKQVDKFRADSLEYFVELTAAYAAELNGQVPLVEYIAGDEYQTILLSQQSDSLSGKSLGYKSIVTVTPAIGASRTYTIHYPVQKSDDATLNMINLGGKPLANYDAERFNYKVEIDVEASVPVVTVIKKEEIQQVEISIDNDTVRVLVTAEDEKTTVTYKLTFERIMSSITTLYDIVLTDEAGQRLPDQQFVYRADKHEYTIGIEYNRDKALTDQIPAIETIMNNPLQTTEMQQHALPNEDIRVDIIVTAPNGENQAIYELTFHFIKPSDATLSNILINEVGLKNFDAQTTEYEYAHPYGSTTADYFTAEAVKAVLHDSLATISEIAGAEDGTIHITVVAQDGTTEITYTITQKIAMDNNNLLSAILLDNGEVIDSLRGFDPNVTFYTYILPEGASSTPLVTATAQSENAEVSPVRQVSAGDTCVIICTAQDGSELRYYIHFAVSTVNEAQEATANDVIAKRLPNSMLFFVGTIRKDVYFALFDENGRLLFYEQVPTADPNDTEIVTDLDGKERLNDIVDARSGLTIELQPNKVYFYTFLAGDKDFLQKLRGDKAKKLYSGKIIALQ